MQSWSGSFLVTYTHPHWNHTTGTELCVSMQKETCMPYSNFLESPSAHSTQHLLDSEIPPIRFKRGISECHHQTSPWGIQHHRNIILCPEWRWNLNVTWLTEKQCGKSKTSLIQHEPSDMPNTAVIPHYPGKEMLHSLRSSPSQPLLLTTRCN